MATEEEKRAFGLHKKYGYTPKKDKSTAKSCTPSGRGKLWYCGAVIKEGTYPLLQLEKRRLLMMGGHKESNFKITK